MCLRPRNSPSVDFWGFPGQPAIPATVWSKISREPLSWSPPSTAQHPEFSRLFPARCQAGTPARPLHLSLTGRVRFPDSSPPPPSRRTCPLALLPCALAPRVTLASLTGLWASEAGVRGPGLELWGALGRSRGPASVLTPLPWLGFQLPELEHHRPRGEGKADQTA